MTNRKRQALIEMFQGAEENDDGIETRPTNVEFLAYLMSFSPYALMQPFVLDALTRQCDAVLQYSADEMEEKFKDTYVSGRAWHACAVELRAAMDKHFAREI